MALKTKAPSAAMPGFVAGDTVRFQTGTHRMADAVRVPMNGVTFEFEKGVVLDGHRGVGNAFYLNGGDDTKLIALDMTSKPRLINYLKTVIYTSVADRFLFLGIYTGYSGSDAWGYSGALDHGIYIDGSTGWTVQDHVSEHMSGHGIQVYSGSSRTTTGKIDGFESFDNGADGLHFGNASTNCVAKRVNLHNNTIRGVYSYGGTGNRIESGNIYANKGAAVVKRVPMYVSPDVSYAAPPGTPPPVEPPPVVVPEPPTTDPCDAVKKELELVRAKANTYAQQLLVLKGELNENAADLKALADGIVA